MTQTPKQKYENALATGNFSRDDVQARAVEYLDNLYHEIIKANTQETGFLKSLFKAKRPHQGAYICGVVWDVVRRG